MKRYTIGQQRALVELRALARTALVVCDALAARGEESDDRPRRYLDALVRWTLGEERPAHLAAATRAMETWRGEVFDALANARRAQAKADKVTAEEALGTLPGMEGR